MRLAIITVIVTPANGQAARADVASRSDQGQAAPKIPEIAAKPDAVRQALIGSAH